ALAVTARLGRLSEQQAHPWGLASSKCCRGMVRLASEPHDEEAAALLQQSAADYEGLGLRFDRARSLLRLGRATRRLKKWGLARGRGARWQLLRAGSARRACAGCARRGRRPS